MENSILMLFLSQQPILLILFTMVKVNLNMGVRHSYTTRYINFLGDEKQKILAKFIDCRKTHQHLNQN